MTGVRKLNWGCGPCIAPGWINSDSVDRPGVDLCCDILEGLPLDSGGIDCIASIHALQDLPYGAIEPALRELWRVLKPGGVLRLGLPDLDKAINAYLAENAAYFYVPDQDAASIGAKLITQIIWYGSVRTPMNFDFIQEWLARSGFHRIVRCAFGVTQSPYPELAGLDNRERESLFVEAVK